MIELTSMQPSTFPMVSYCERTSDIGSCEEQRQALPVGLLLYGASGVGSISVEWPLDFLVATNVGLSNSLFKVELPSAQDALQEIKSTTGLTWQQLARVFKVNPRSLHLWMDGKALDSAHQERVYRMLTIVRELPFSGAFQNRTFLLAPQPDGTILLDLLARGDDDAFMARIAGTPARASVGVASLANDRRPLPPSILMDATQDTVHVDLPGRRIVKPLKRKDSEG
jgi:hypothetical protein